MAEVDYSRYIYDPSKKIDEGIASLAQALQYRQQLKRQSEQDAQAKQLHDLQVAKLQEEQRYQEGLKSAMANPQSTTTVEQSAPQPLPSLASLGINTPDYVPMPNAAPDMAAQENIAGLHQQVNKYPGLAALSGSDKRLAEMQAANPPQRVASTGSLAGLLSTPEPPRPSLGTAPEFGAQPPQAQAPLLPGAKVSTQTQTPEEAAAKYALANGRTEDATKYINLTETLAKQAAQAKAYGSVAKAAEAETVLDRMTKASTLYAKMLKEGGSTYAKAQVTQHPEIFGKIDASQIEDDGGIVKYPVGNGQFAVYHVSNPGQIHLSAAPPHDKEVETWGPAYETSVGGKKAMVQKSNRGQIRPVIQDTSTTVKVTTGASGQGKPPAGYRWQADGTLEPIPGGPATKVGPGKVLPAGQLESMADMKRVKDVLTEADQVLKSGKVGTGPVAGRVQSIGAKVGLASSDFVNLQQKLQTAQNIMLKLRSGAAVTENEYERFLKEYPTPNDTPAVRDRKMRNTIDYATSLMDEKLSIYEEGGYRIPQSVKSGAPVSRPAQKPAQAQNKRPLPKF